MYSRESTPYRTSSDETESKLVRVSQIQDALKKELDDCWVPRDDSALLSEMFPLPNVSDDAIRDFIDDPDHGHYNHGLDRWNNIPSMPLKEAQLHTPFVELINNIIAYFTGSSHRRGAVDTHNTPMKHVCQVERCLKTNPDISLLAAGRSISKEPTVPFEASPTYTRLANPIENKLQRKISERRDRIQLAVYAREIFAQQPNRKFVSSVLLTEENIRVYKFDRSGVVSSRWFNIHKERIDFVRIILGISCLDEEALGYDTSIFWDGETRWLTLTPNQMSTEDEDGQIIIKNVTDSDATLKFKIVGEPTFHRQTIRGRATTCWTVEDEDGRQYHVKDYWRAANRTAESELLKEAHGIRGVNQMFACQDRIDSTSNTPSASSAQSSNPQLARELDRIVSPLYGGDLMSCETVEELVDAIRDIVVAHYSLLRKKGILHRDISLGNLVRGGRYTSLNGILIDLDMAVNMKTLLGDKQHTLGDFRTGTRAFQSIKVLYGMLWHHDHLDDLESIFYVLCWICYGTEQPGSELKKAVPEFLADWDNIEKPHNCARLKHSFISTDLPILSLRWEATGIYSLLENMREFFSPRVKLVHQVVRTLKPDDMAPTPDLTHVRPYTDEGADEDYNKFLAIIDEWRETHPRPLTPESPQHDPFSATDKKVQGLKPRRSSRLSSRGQHEYMTPENTPPLSPRQSSPRTPKRKADADEREFEKLSTPTKKLKTYSSKPTRRHSEFCKFLTPDKTLPLSPQRSSPRTPKRKVNDCDLEEPLTPTKKTKTCSSKSTRIPSRQQNLLTPENTPPLSPQPPSPRTPIRKADTDENNLEDPSTPTKKRKTRPSKPTR